MLSSGRNCRKKTGPPFQKATPLCPAEQVGVWLFRPKSRPRGSEIVEVKLGEAGLYDTGFDDVAIALSNDGANIFDRIRESR